MTTQVTVQYDGDRLLERSRQQQQAARQVKASSDRIKAAASTDKAQQQRAGTLPQQQAQRYGTLEQRLRVRDEPAASTRISNEYFLMQPISGPVGNQIQLINKGFISYLTVGLKSAAYSATEGPSGNSALIATAATRGNYVSLRGQFPFNGSTSKYKSGVKDFTLEFYFKLGTSYSYAQDEPDISIRIGTVGYVDVFIAFQSRFGVAYRVLYCAVRQNFGAFPQFVAGISEDMANPNGSTLRPGAWQHFAVSKKNNTIKAFLDGQQIGSLQVAWQMIDFEPQGVNSWADIYFGNSSVLDIPGQPVYLHGLRFDTRAIYTAQFTPPLIP